MSTATKSQRQMVKSISSTVKIPTVVSLFAGAGGIDLGLKKAGLNIVWAVDNDEDCVETYKRNIGKHIICKNIEDIPSSEIPCADIIIGGFPCQGFSMANRFRTPSDSRNTLYKEMLRVISDLQPKWFVAENVKGILSLGGGDIFKNVLNDFIEAGYRVRYELVNMADHGIPQMRKRVVILGTRKDLPEELDAFHPIPTHANETIGKKKWVTVNEALSILDGVEDYPNKIGSQYKVAYRNYTGHRQTDGNRPCPTLLARGNGKGGVCAIPHPNGMRRLNVRESALMQTFPIDFEFVGKVGSMYRQIGNAIPVEYGRRVGKMFNLLAQKESELL